MRNSPFKGLLSGVCVDEGFAPQLERASEALRGADTLSVLPLEADGFGQAWFFIDSRLRSLACRVPLAHVDCPERYREMFTEALRQLLHFLAPPQSSALGR